jgi:hypothetical protein
MSAWKQFLASDIIVTPFEVSKGFTFPSSQFATGSDGELVGIDRFIGKNIPFTLGYFNPDAEPTTGTLSTQYQSLVYNSIQQLYFTNYLSSSTGDTVSQPYIFPGSDSSGNVLLGDVQSPLYDNFLQSTLVPDRFWPTSSGADVTVISIPSKLYGDYIVPNSLKLETTLTSSGGTYTVIDDGEGNLVLENNTNFHYGNVIYTHGLVIFTVSGSIFEGYGTSTYGGSGEYGEGFPPALDWATSPITCSFSSSYKIYEAQYKCTIRESEYNATLNPSAQSGGSMISISGSTFYKPGDGTLKDNVTGSYFSPYVTTVGLYDENQNLLAVGKLAQPLPTSATTDTTILVNIDK